MKSRVLIAGVAAALGLAAPPASADVAGAFREAWKCAKSVPGSVAALGADVVAKAEAVAAMSASVGVCTAQAGGQPQALAFVTTTLGAIKASTDLLPTGKCKERIRGAVARPFALGIAALMPEGKVKAELLALARSDQAAGGLWSVMSGAPPPFGAVPAQLDCGCDLIEGALTLTDISTVTSVIRNTSKACAGILDQAGVGFLNDWGSAAIAWIGGQYRALSGAWQGWMGKKDAAPDEIAYQGLFGVYVPQLARQLATMAPGTSPFALKIMNVHDGWSNKATVASNYLMTWGDLTDECRHYYDTRKFSGDHKGKCDAFKSRAAGEAQKDGARLRLQGTSMTVFRLKLYGWLEREWLWRLPPCESYGPGNVYPHRAKGEENRCFLQPVINDDRWKLGSFTENKSEPWAYKATGIYALARDALVHASYDMDAAHTAVLAGSYAAVQQRTRESWGTPPNRENVRYRWLPKWMPAPPMTARYGCSGGGAIEQACIAQIEQAFDAVCHPLIRDAWVMTPNVLAAAGRFNEAKVTCQKLLGAIVSNAEALGEAGQREVPAAAQARCPAPAQDRDAAAACTAKLAAAWEDCARTKVGLVVMAGSSAVAEAKQCFAQRAKGAPALPAGGKLPDVKVPAGGLRPPKL